MKTRIIAILSICSLFLFYKYIVQLFPSLIGNELIKTYGYNGFMLAIMASSYYYSYTFMQIMAGAIIDRFAMRLPMFIAITMISMTVMLFTHTSNFYLMCLSRILMGFGASFATVLYMKCAAYYTGPKTFGLISSLLATATMLGAACGGTPVALLFQKMGWKEGLNLLAMIGLVIALAALVFIKSTTNNNSSLSKMTLENVKTVVVNKGNWLLLIYSGLTFSPIVILGGVWGTPFLISKFSINATQASFFLSVMFVGHAIGSPLWALVSAKLNNRNQLMHIANILAFICLACIIYGNTTYGISLFLFFVFGFSVGCFMLSFEICREINAFYVMGLSVAFINTGEGLVGSIVEPFIGYLLDLFKETSTFTLANYQLALSILPCCFILSSITLSYMYKKTAAKSITQLASI